MSREAADEVNTLASTTSAIRDTTAVATDEADLFARSWISPSR
jgi:hypothetical protein